MKLRDRYALVTGSSRGIGSAIAARYAAEGAHVILHGRDRAALERQADDIEAAGGRCTTLAADLTQSDDVERLLHGVESRFGRLDILVANAGGSFARPGPIEDLPVDEWHASLDNNLTATFLTLRAFLPMLKRQGAGAVVTIASAAGRRAYSNTPVSYAAAKAAVIHLTRLVAAQAGPSGVRVNCIAPETILTARNLERIPAALMEGMIDSHPLKRLGQPIDVAEAALYLVSGESDWITGIVLDVAGGAVLM